MFKSWWLTSPPPGDRWNLSSPIHHGISFGCPRQSCHPGFFWEPGSTCSRLRGGGQEWGARRGEFAQSWQHWAPRWRERNDSQGLLGMSMAGHRRPLRISSAFWNIQKVGGGGVTEWQNEEAHPETHRLCRYVRPLGWCFIAPYSPSWKGRPLPCSISCSTPYLGYFCRLSLGSWSDPDTFPHRSNQGHEQVR